MDEREKIVTISEESVEACFTLHAKICQTAVDGNCPIDMCKNAYEKAALIALKNIEGRD